MPADLAPVPTVAVVGGGPAGLMAAERLAGAGVAVTVFDRMATFGRKFLMAGRGGLNLTHSEPLDQFLSRYGAAADWLEPSIRSFPPDAARAWSEGLGQDVFVGSSGRVFPRAMKASPLLRAWLGRLVSRGVAFAPRHRWQGFADDGRPVFATEAGRHIADADAVVLALGGASWPKLGSDGSWTETLTTAGIEVAPLSASNVGVLVPWSTHVRDRFEGQPLKRIAVRVGEASVRGEAVITARGLEGGAIYAVSAALRDAFARSPDVTLTLDLRPDVAHDALARRLADTPAKQSLATRLAKVAKLSPAAVAVLREAHGGSPPRPADDLARAIKAVPLTATGLGGLDRAISTAGGIVRDAVDGRFMLKARPGVFVAGEMLDWDAPTGGYLLQATMATGRHAAEGALAWLADQGAGKSADVRPSAQ